MKMLKELKDNYKELSENYISMKKEIETLLTKTRKKWTIKSWKQKTLEGITSRLDEAEDQISELQDKVEKKHPDRARKGKETQKEQTGSKGAARQHEM